MNAVGIDVSKGKSMVAVLRSLGITLVVLIQNDFRFRIPKPVTSAYCFHLPEHLAIYPVCPPCTPILSRAYPDYKHVTEGFNGYGGE